MSAAAAKNRDRQATITTNENLQIRSLLTELGMQLKMMRNEGHSYRGFEPPKPRINLIAPQLFAPKTHHKTQMRTGSLVGPSNVLSDNTHRYVTYMSE